MRIFIGLSFPDPVNSALATLRGSLPFINWNDPDTYHLTLCFVGEIKNYNLLNELDLALEKIKVPSFDIHLEGVNYFMSPNQSMTFGVLLRPSDPLLHLKKKIEHVVRSLDIPIGKQKLVPHITLAKGTGLTEEQIGNWLHTYNLFKISPITIQQFSLFSSYPKQDGPCYITESDYILSK
ncbi:RNA 2',3'-cyclic phosphodiesterase [Commensalibacter oyaizuii]|uniref:RNA 2',3'-cyclic phosphodiesterase n=1 Tax=Commensalibacter oyaizuii TaxID=3043873 RepID=A0ABT6PYU0_9PROT|nr:RNA 2',3'-cyclic phosphodiesterase [Commensalibacter sp. TBRC 16381]MDI2090032.1 RNA 2',3'-cyclic phosphodiesterase [Commensalibacter sp. TBRC 16381]